jgi:transposase-like protein
MERVDRGPAATLERRDRAARGYRRFRCRDCSREFNERSGGLLNVGPCWRKQSGISN